ncbi:hypothetical protein fugu_000842 [Takifugu bimaculatus]|uniref:FHF complex subunit HOOK-interacting protein 1B n=1 Tax=Takifugu bimaculatus TaxID=433685 RepID=A0A4Z2CHT2_9TELE|nr:hypothetical protein fugu_000842 [Takifugu bimaculatus]
MSWMSRLNPRGPGNRQGHNAAAPGPCTADPETCLMVFENHWRQVSWVLEQREPSSSSDDLTAVRNHTDQMLCLLADEQPSESSDGDGTVPNMGPILELVVRKNILERLIHWHLRRGLDSESQGALLKLFEMLIGQSQQPLLQHSAVLHPLLRLLGACAEPEVGCPAALENSLVLLLNQICVSMARQPVVLEKLFQAAPAEQCSTNFLIFSLLVPFIHREGAIGQQARDSLLLVMAASASHDALAHYITENSYFCPVLATGLSALYSSLPRKIEVQGDDWHALRREDWMGVSSLKLFMNSLEFCNAVVQVAHPLVRSQLLDYLHNGFLVPVMGPTLHTLCMVSLSLFQTLLSLNCEDVMLQLILRYLLPCNHVMLSQRRSIRETDIYGKSADKFLSLIPECCRLNTMHSTEQEEDGAFWGRVLNSPSTESTGPLRSSTPSRLAFFMRQQSSGGGSGGGGPSTPTSMESLYSGSSGSHPLAPDSPRHQLCTNIECLAWNSGYLEYLKDARQCIEVCSWACRDWSAPYDGENPSPNTVLPPPRQSNNPSMAMFPEHFSVEHREVSNTPPGQPKAAILSAGRSEVNSSDLDSGDWDVTIGKNNCISLTPRSKKRSLQRDELTPNPNCTPPSSSSLTPLLQNRSTLSSANHILMCSTTGGSQTMYNGTTGQEETCSDNRDRLEIKKAKRDLEDPKDLDENANQSGSLVTCLSQSCTSVPQAVFSTSEMNPSLSLCTNQIPTPNPEIMSSTESDILNSHSTSTDTVDSTQTESVESLIQELLEEAPGDSQLGADSNGRGINIEAFTQELSELEDRVKDCRRAASQQEELPGNRLEEEQQQQPPPPRPPSAMAHEVKLTTDIKGGADPLSSSARLQNQTASQPYTGPFMVVLLTKLENMLQNSLYVNILLTGIVAQLACYPQPLLRSFLLNTNMVFQPSVKSLIQVLGSVKNRIEVFAASHEDFPGMLKKAQQYLVARGKVDRSDGGVGVAPLRRADSLVKSRKSSIGDLILRHTNSPTRARHAAQLALSQSLHNTLFRGSAGSRASGQEKQAEVLRVKNAVYCAIIFCEFLKELAALAQEHAVTLPFSHSQGAEE